MPWPEALSSPRLPMSKAVSIRISLMVMTSRSGLASRIRATMPATCGPDIDVPLMVAYEPPGAALITYSPGATTSGLIW
jgi:hypothetical protein